ncbi:MAG: response regulator [Armatimonadetes bacterium]|nr:response regulator [Armatimonadota bacterium]MDW8028430.1 response regulator [Armatimonadota bacterium]
MAAKILVVEDDRDIAEAVKLTLERAGYQIINAYNPEEAWQKVNAEKPDLIVLDIMMPTGTEGFQFVWKLRSPQTDESIRNVPIVVLTSLHSTTELRFYPDQYDASYGPSDFLPVQEFLDKPVDPSKLVEAVERVLKQSK